MYRTGSLTKDSHDFISCLIRGYSLKIGSKFVWCAPYTVVCFVVAWLLFPFLCYMCVILLFEGNRILLIQVNGVFWPMFWFFLSCNELCRVKINIFFLIDKSKNVQLTTNASANKACQNDVLKLTCLVGDANPEVTSYHLFRNGTDVGESNTRMWVETQSNSGLSMYKCVANNSVGSSESPSVSITVNGNPEFRFFISTSFNPASRAFLLFH